jgi:hypothetical protein
MRNRPSGKRSYRFVALCTFTMGTAIGMSIALIQRVAGRHHMPNLKAWQMVLIARYGEVSGSHPCCPYTGQI